MTLPIDQLATLLRDAAKAEILPRFRRLGEGDIREKTSAIDLVTEADEAAERFIKRECAALLPDALFVGEEGVAADRALLARIGDADLIEQKVTFPVSGTDDGDPQVIVMRVDDTVGTDVDPALDGLVVVFNASAEDVEQVVPGLAGEELELSAVQAAGADDVVRGATWDVVSGTASVPARTVAVFVQP